MSLANCSKFMKKLKCIDVCTCIGILNTFPENIFVLYITPFRPDYKANPAYGLMMSVCPSVRPSVRPSLRLFVRLSIFWLTWLTSAFKFVLGRINQYILDTLNGNSPW